MNSFKKLLPFLILVSNISLAQIKYKSSKNVPDILIQTKMDTNWSEYLIQKVRTFFKNNDEGDIFQYELKDSISASFKPLENYSDPLAKKILDAVKKLFNIEATEAEVQITINGLSYKMEKLSTKMIPLSKPGDELLSHTTVQIGELSLETPQIIVDVQLPNKKGELKSFFSFKINDLLVQSSQNERIEFESDILFKHNEVNNYNFKFTNTNFTNLENKLSNQSDLFLIDQKVNFEFPEVKIQVGDRVAIFPAKKINNFIKDQLPQIKKLLMKQFVNILKSGDGAQMIKSLETAQFEREYWEDLELMSMFSFDHITNNDKGHVIVEMSSDYCTKTEFEFSGKECYLRDFKKDIIRPGNEIRINKSVQIMDELLQKENGNIVVSASEEYITRILIKTFDAGFWDDSFKELPVSLGPKKMAVLFNEKGNDGTLLLDLLYNTTKLERIATGQKQIKFPMMMKINAKIENVKGVPNLVVNISDINMTDDFLLNGDKATGFVSSINQSRFKKMVLKTVKNILKDKKLIGQDILSIELPEIRDLELESAHFFSDGNGRALGLMKLDKNKIEGIKLDLDQNNNFKIRQ